MMERELGEVQPLKAMCLRPGIVYKSISSPKMLLHKTTTYLKEYC